MVEIILQVFTGLFSLITSITFLLIYLGKLNLDSLLWRKSYLLQVLTFTTYIFYFAAVRGRCPFGSPGEALLFVSWFLSVFFYFLDKKMGERSIGFFMIPLITILTIFSFVIMRISDPLPAKFFGSLFPLHVSFILLSYVFFLLSFSVAFVEWRVFSGLKKRERGFFFHKLPALSDLEKQMKIFLFSAILLLPIGLVFGVIWAVQENISANILNLKLVFTVLTWLFFLGLYIFKKLGSSYKKSLFLAFLGLVFMLITFLLGNHAY